MEGVQQWDASKWHAACEGVVPVSIGAFAHLWCPVHRCLCNLEAVAPKTRSFESSEYPYSGAKDAKLEPVKVKA